MDDIVELVARGMDFGMDSTMLSFIKSAFTNLPHPPAATAAPLSGAVPARAPDGIDRISCLPAGILRDIISRLPVKDAGRTTVLSKRWRRIWHTTSLVLVDAHLLPGTRRRRQSRLGAEAEQRYFTDAVSAVLARTRAPSAASTSSAPRVIPVATPVRSTREREQSQEKSEGDRISGRRRKTTFPFLFCSVLNI
ncbi:unnamed protein product [Urochloa humidicola]